jgi:hypothetical protein
MRHLTAVALGVATFAAAVFGVAPRAGASESLGWWFTAAGSAHCAQDANHVVCRKFDRAGNHLGPVLDVWLPWFCTVGTIAAGDNAGTPLRIRFRSPWASGPGCIGNGQSAYHGWSDGYGHTEGQNYWAPAYAHQDTVYVFPRDTATPAALGTQVAIY